MVPHLGDWELKKKENSELFITFRLKEFITPDCLNKYLCYLKWSRAEQRRK
jgi:hypothetical protein